MTESSISVVIPTFNRAHYLGEAIASVQAQGEVVREILVVDDGSTDDTEAVLTALGEPRVRFLRQENRGPAAARNLGWKSSTRPWVAFLDSDDRLAEGALPALLAAGTAHPGHIPFGWSEIRDATFSEPPYATVAMAPRSGWIAQYFCRPTPPTIFACLFPRSALEALDGFSLDPAVHLAEDFDLGLRLTLRHRFVRVDRICYRVRMHATNRHREHQLAVNAAVMASIAAHVRGGLRTELMRRRLLGRWHATAAVHELGMGSFAAARRSALTGLVQWPLHPSLWRTLGSSLRGRRPAMPET